MLNPLWTRWFLRYFRLAPGGLLESPGSLFAEAVKAEAAAAFPAAVQVTPSVDADTAAALLAHRCLRNMESLKPAGY